MLALPCSDIPILLDILIKTRTCDRHTNEETDTGHSIYRSSIASRGKNEIPWYLPAEPYQETCLFYDEAELRNVACKYATRYGSLRSTILLIGDINCIFSFQWTLGSVGDSEHAGCS